MITTLRAILNNWLGCVSQGDEATITETSRAPLLVFVFYVLAAIAHSQTIIGRIPTLIGLTFLLGLTAIPAIVREFLEYLADAALGTKMNLGVADTLADLFFGLLGGGVIMALAARAVRAAPVYASGSADEA